MTVIISQEMDVPQLAPILKLDILARKSLHLEELLVVLYVVMDCLLRKRCAMTEM